MGQLLHGDCSAGVILFVSWDATQTEGTAHAVYIFSSLGAVKLDPAPPSLLLNHTSPTISAKMMNVSNIFDKSLVLLH